VAAFKELLESKCTSHKMTWAELVPLVSSDPRWRAVKSTGEKKNLFQHLMAQKQRDAIDQVSSPLTRSQAPGRKPQVASPRSQAPGRNRPRLSATIAWPRTWSISTTSQAPECIENSIFKSV
jgi:hypothetical protein